VSFGEPAYAQLAGACPPEIVTGADDEGEMGAWHFVQGPLRLRNLRAALDEYLRFGLEAGAFITPQQPRRAAAAVSREARRQPGARPAAGRQAKRQAKRPARTARAGRDATTSKQRVARKKQAARTSRRVK
jgi:hypothetical protein